MAKYKVIKTYKYTAEVEVEADSKWDAEELSTEMEDEKNPDDWLFDCNATLIKGENK